jgi:membrane protein YdbS with pleckstrin-like domain
MKADAPYSLRELLVVLAIGLAWSILGYAFESFPLWPLLAAYSTMLYVVMVNEVRP